MVKWKDFKFIQHDKFKKLSKEAHDKLFNSIVNNNFVESFKVWQSGKDLYCLDGFHRIRVLNELIEKGYSVPDKFRADFIKCKDKKEASRLVLIYSSIYAQITEEGFLQYLKDNNLSFEEVKNVIDIPDFNLEYFELKNFTSEVKEDNFNADEEYGKIKKVQTKAGDIWSLGEHRLMNGDSKSENDFKKLMQGEKAGLIFTDPPYNVNYKSPGGLTYSSEEYGGRSGKIFNDNLSDKECFNFYKSVLDNLYNFSEVYSPIYWWYASMNQHINREAFLKSKWHFSQILIWIKNGFVLSKGQDYHRGYEPCMFGWKKGKSHHCNKSISNLKDVYNLDYNDFQELLDFMYVKRDATQNYVHPTQKPVRLAERAFHKSTKEGTIVIDAFGGSGSTLICAEQMKRKARVIELDEKYCDVIVKRYIKFCRENNKEPKVLKNNKKIDLKVFED